MRIKINQDAPAVKSGYRHHIENKKHQIQCRAVTEHNYCKAVVYSEVSNGKAEQDKQLAKQDKQLEEQGKQLATKDAYIAELEARLKIQK